MVKKRCPTCNTTKLLDDFHRSKERKDGHQGRCKECMNKITRQYIDSKAGKATQRRYHQSEKGKESRRRNSKNSRQRYPEKTIARKRVETARLNGTIPQPNTLLCTYCPSKARQYHHHLGYEPKHWLDVQPLCTSCHGKIHAGYIL